MSDISKAVGHVWSRLFDHRGFVGGEINYLLQEFELKRGDKEVDNLFKTIESITDIKDTQIDKFDDNVRDNLTTTIEDLGEALFLCKRFTELENRPKSQKLEASREKRKADWNNFMDFITTSYLEINNDYENKEDNLREVYNNLKLKINQEEK